MSGIDERSERKQCRSGDKPEFITAGHMMKNHMTVINNLMERCLKNIWTCGS